MTKELPGRGTPRGLWADWGAAAAGVVVLIGAAVVLFWPMADLVARHDVGSLRGATATQRLDALHRARDAARGRLFQLGAGVLAAGALFYTSRNFRLAREQNELNRRTLELTEQGQVTDRFTKAIEQLGASALEVRLGGIYALERISRDSARDYSTIMEVLSAFIRDHAHEPWPPLDPNRAIESEDVSEPAGRRRLRQDVRAALTVISRRPSIRQRIDLTGADFSHVDLSSVRLVAVDLSDACFTGADLTRADLEGSDLGGARLSGADLMNANLAGAKLDCAVLTNATLNGAILVGADLGLADLTGSELIGANLTDTELREADLTDTDFRGAVVTRALIDADTPLPPGWGHDKGRAVRLDIDIAET